MFHCSRECHCHTWLQRSDLAPGKIGGSGNAPPPARREPSTGPQKCNLNAKGKAAQHAGAVTPLRSLQSEEGRGSALMATVRAFHKHQMGTKSCRHHSDLPTHKAEETHRGDSSADSCPSAAALSHTTFPPPACQAGGWSCRGSRWLSPPLQASPSAAAGSYQMEGPQQQ